MNKANIVILVIAAAVLLAVGSAQTAAVSEPVGRYQLLSGESVISGVPRGTSGPDRQPQVLRIDTVTGKTSVWVKSSDASLAKPPDYKYTSYNYWLPIDESQVAHSN
jgi:hypothetical protein